MKKNMTLLAPRFAALAMVVKQPFAPAWRAERTCEIFPAPSHYMSYGRTTSIVHCIVAKMPSSVRTLDAHFYVLVQRIFSVIIIGYHYMICDSQKINKYMICCDLGHVLNEDMLPSIQFVPCRSYVLARQQL